MILLLFNSALGLLCILVCLKVRAAVAELEVGILRLLREYVTHQDCRDRHKEKGHIERY